jgi:hypothetical protein
MFTEKHVMKTYIAIMEKNYANREITTKKLKL